ncbi:MAG: cyclodeaminase/cyclohydrolase family protein [Anaerolineae bacterium]|nr:cyclodeaminase/cyclohydrolase family protein [Anaerolineae bacterium]
MLTESTFRHLTAHIASARTAMAGATIAASAALACALGEACVRLNFELLDEAGRRDAQDLAAQLSGARAKLESLCDEDGEAITAFATLRAAGETLHGQERLCEMPAAMAELATEAAIGLQGFRPFIQVAQDDLEMAITLLDGVLRAAILLLDSNLRIWPEPVLLARFEPVLVQLRALAEDVALVQRIR